MDIDKFVADLKVKFPVEQITAEVVNKKRLMIYILADALLKMSDYLFNELGFRYIIVSAMDSRPGYELIYHFSDDSSGWIINLNVIIPHDKPEIESLVPIIKGTEWIEREIFDLLGIIFLHHPNLKRFLLAESWPDKEYPLRREHKQEK